MSDPAADGDPGRDGHAEPDREETTGLAPWQKVVGVVGLIVLLVLLVLTIAGGHTPRTHGSGGPIPGAFVRYLHK